MRTLYIIVVALLVIATTTVSHADNGACGPDSPWDDDSTAAIPVRTLPDDAAAGRAGVNAPVYDLQGRRVASPQRGQIYIVAGRKVVWAN